MSTNIRANLEAIIKGIQDNQILATFDKYYHDDVVMSEKGDTTNRIGKPANRVAEENFANNAKIHEAKVLKIMVDGNLSGYQMYMKFNYGEHLVEKTQWAIQEWSNGLIIREDFF
eukprot:gene3950-4574_t